MIAILVTTYVFSVLITFLIHYFDKHTQTVRDLLKHLLSFLTPGVNTFFAIALIYLSIKDSNYITNFLNKKLWWKN